MRARVSFLAQIVALSLGCVRAAGALDLNRAVVITAPDASPRQRQAARMLIEEAEKRIGILWPQLTAWPQTNVPVIAVGLKAAAREFAGPHADAVQKPSPATAAEGFRRCVRPAEKSPAALVPGNDERGVLFGVGRLLRELHMTHGNVSVHDNLDVTTAPEYALRGHQLGYRPKCNS